MKMNTWRGLHSRDIERNEQWNCYSRRQSGGCWELRDVTSPHLSYAYFDDVTKLRRHGNYTLRDSRGLFSLGWWPIFCFIWRSFFNYDLALPVLSIVNSWCIALTSRSHRQTTKYSSKNGITVDLLLTGRRLSRVSIASYITSNIIKRK